MRYLFIALILALSACATTQSLNSKTSEQSTGYGLSIEQAAVIKANNSEEGIRSEYEWLQKRHPGFKREKQALVDRGSKFYDQIEITTREGERKTYYFDITSFFGKW